MLYAYLVVCLFLLGLVALVYHVASRWGRLRGTAAALLSLALLIACWPIPIHGGFLLLGEVFISELRSLREREREERDTARHDAFIAASAERFRGRLEFERGARVAPGWERGRADGEALWFDKKSGLIWSDTLELADVEPEALLSEARETCAAHPPRGYWGLPTDAEGYFLWRHGGEAIVPRRPGRYVSQRIDTNFQLAIPIIQIVRSSPRPNSGPAHGETPWVVRCVALGPVAPPRGYLDLDVKREDWNAYQLAKLGSPSG